MRAPTRGVGSRHRASRAFLGAAMVGALVLGACAGGDNRSPNLPPAPARGAQPDTIAVMANNFVDTDGNRFRDTASVIIYLFAQNHPVPIAAEGSFSFVLESMEGHRIAEWRFDRERTAQALGELGPGPAFHFELSLLKADSGIGTDRIADSEAELTAIFTPAAARRGDEIRPIRRRGTPLQIGPVGGSRGR